MASSSGFPRHQEKLERLVGLHQSRGAEFGNALPNEDFQYFGIWRSEGSTCHHVYEILVPLRKTRVSTGAMDCSDVGVRLHEEGARLGLPLAAVKECDPKESFTGLDTGVRGEHVIGNKIKPRAERRRRRLCSPI